MLEYMYICEHGHMTRKPEMGSFERCQELVIVPGTNGRGRVACACPLVKVVFDPVLEAAHKMGGPDAVLAAVREQIANGAPRARGSGGRI